MTTRMLELMGYTVIAASTPQEAISSAHNYKGTIHLLITDVILPQMDGKKLSEEIAKMHQDIKCIFISGYPADFITQRGILQEGLQFIQKPFTIDTLCTKIRQALDNTL